MGEVRPIPTLGGVVRDVRGRGRALRVSWHREDGLVVLSLWDGPRCTGTVRVAAGEVPVLVEALQAGLQRPVVGSQDAGAARDQAYREGTGAGGGLDLLGNDPGDGVAG
jgi:hypothetical protein